MARGNAVIGGAMPSTGAFLMRSVLLPLLAFTGLQATQSSMKPKTSRTRRRRSLRKRALTKLHIQTHDLQAAPAPSWDATAYPLPPGENFSHDSNSQVSVDDTASDDTDLLQSVVAMHITNEESDLPSTRDSLVKGMAGEMFSHDATHQYIVPLLVVQSTTNGDVILAQWMSSATLEKLVIQSHLRCSIK